MAQLQALEPERARLQAVIAYCETKMAGEAASPEPPGQPPGTQQAAGEGDSPGSGRLPDRNEDGLTRAELTRRMLQDGLPLGPRQMAERFYGRTDLDRGRVENFRRILRGFAADGFAIKLADGLMTTWPRCPPWWPSIDFGRCGSST